MNLPQRKQTVLSVILALGLSDAFAVDGWDCQRNGNDKEWVCVSGKDKPAKPVETDQTAKPAEAAKPPARVKKPTPNVAESPQPPTEASPSMSEAPQPPKEASPSTFEAQQPPKQASPSTFEPSPQPPVQSTLAPVEGTAKPSETAPPIPSEEPLISSEGTKALVQTKKTEPKRTLQTDQPLNAKAAVPQITAEKPQARPVTTATAQASTPNPEQQPQAKSGWNCNAEPGMEWNCSLSGYDPRGTPHVVDGGKAIPDWAKSTDMTDQDEQRFTKILAHMPANPWALSCGKDITEWTTPTQFLLSDADQLLRQKSPLEIKSDQAELIQGETSSYRGVAELVRADQTLFGDFVTHNSKSGALNAQGEVVYREKGLSFAGDTAFMKLNSDEGVIRNSQFIVETVPARGTSRVTHIESKKRSRYETATYTSCPPGDQDWLMHADTVIIDKDTGKGTAKQAWLEFKGVPFFYTPLMSFPVDSRRKSGWLSPNVGYSALNGFDFYITYYFNLAPNYDLSLIPRYLFNRGPMLRADFRYLSEIGRGRLFADIVPYDELLKETRWQVGWTDKTKWTDQVNSQVDLHLVSDPLYIQQLGNLLAINNSTWLRSFGTVNYTGGRFLGGSYGANMTVDYYQALDATITNQNYPYRRLPQLNFYYSRPVADTGIQFQTNVEATNFNQNYEIEGERINLRPRIFYPFKEAGGFITPSLTLQHTEYWLNNLQTSYNNSGVLIRTNESSTFFRTAPIFSIDSGAYFDNEFKLFDSPMQQTLEPRLFYLFVPKVNQPYYYNYGPGVGVNPVNGQTLVGYQGLNFDAAEYDFNFYQLFRENRFAGVDRLSDANNITPALTTRLISQDSGLERLRLSVGKVFYLTTPQVVMTLNAPQPTFKNNLVSELSSKLNQYWTLTGTGQYNPQYDRLDRLQLGLQYNNFSNNLLNLFYRYRRDPYEGSTIPYPVNPLIPRTINQTDINARLPIWGGWYAIGRWQYSLESQLTVEAMAGVEKETCCWRFSLIALRYQNGAATQTGTTITAASTITTNSAIYFQLELKGLGNFGDTVDNLLLQNFNGYRTDYELPGLYTQPQQAYN